MGDGGLIECGYEVCLTTRDEFVRSGVHRIWVGGLGGHFVCDCVCVCVCACFVEGRTQQASLSSSCVLSV